MNESTENTHNSAVNDKPDAVTKILMKYSRWRRKRFVAESKVPLRLLLLRTGFLTGCILIDGVLLPWVITIMNRSILSYALFVAAFGLAVFLQARFYYSWKQT